MKGYFKDKKVSASQLSTWIKSPKDYIEQYINDKPFIGNKYTDFGSYIHKKIENDEPEMKHIPKLSNKEHYFEKEWDGIILNGYIDSYDIGEIFDYKIAKVGRWSQQIVNKHNQLLFYGLWHKLEHNKLPRTSIIHIETNEQNGKLYLTGDYIQFKKQITKKDIEYIISKIKEFVQWCEEYKNEKRFN